MRRVILVASVSLLLLGALAVQQYLHFNDGLLHIVYCDVGQGDAILIRTPTNKHILVDGGPDRKVIDCLAKHMPFWERTIDLMMLTHPHADHFMGMFYVLERYTITSFATEKLNNKSEGFQEFVRELKEREIPLKYVSAGDRWVINDQNTNQVVLSILSPSTEFLQRTSPNGEIGEGKEFANIIAHLQYGSLDVLFTGDSQAQALFDAADRMGESLEVLQVPHHGSATGLTRAFLHKHHPKLTIISVGAKNRYGHPNTNVLQSLIEEKVPFFRTDQRGDIEIVSDGGRFTVNN